MENIDKPAVETENPKPSQGTSGASPIEEQTLKKEPAIKK